MLAVSFEAVVQPTAPSTRSASGFLCAVFVSDNDPRISQVFLWSWIFVELFWYVFVDHQHCYLAEKMLEDGGLFRGFGASKAWKPEKMHQCSYDHGNQWLTVNLNFRPYFLGVSTWQPGGGPRPLRFPWGWHHPDLRYCWEWCLFTYPAIACVPLGSVDPNVPSILAAKLHQIACSLSCFKRLYPDVTLFFKDYIKSIIKLRLITSHTFSLHL